MEWKIYVHTNKKNNKRYVGITSKSVEERWGNNGRRYLKKKNGKYIHRAFAPAIKKYGWDLFYHDILATCETLEEASKLEQLYIGIFRSNEKKYGYNLTNGGEGSSGRKHTEETKKKISKSLKGKHCSSEHEFKKGHHSKSEWRCKKVKCIETGEIFNSVADAIKWVGANKKSGNISRCCKGKRKTAYGYHWEYVVEWSKAQSSK